MTEQELLEIQAILKAHDSKPPPWVNQHERLRAILLRPHGEMATCKEATGSRSSYAQPEGTLARWWRIWGW